VTPAGWVLCSLVGLFMALSIGVWLGDYRRGLHDAAELQRLAARNRRLAISRLRWRTHARTYRRYAQQLEGDLDLADRALAEYREAIPQVWDRAFEAGQHIAEFQLARASVEQAERSTARWN
jgi:hypothetical protein